MIQEANPAFWGMQPYRGTEATCGFFQRPWRRYLDTETPDAIFLMIRQNHRVFHTWVLTYARWFERLSYLTPELCPVFFRKDVLPSEIRAKPQPPRELGNVPDANNRKVEVCGVINLSVRIANLLERVSFQAVERLTTD